MAYTRKDHPINSADFYPLAKAEIDYIRRCKVSRLIPFIIASIVIISVTFFIYIMSGSNFSSGFIPFLVFSSVGWICLIVSVCQIFRCPVGGRYATIVSCYATQETTGGSGDETTNTTHYFTVKFDDTGAEIRNFTGSMYAKVFQTGSRVLVVKNKISNYDVFPAEPLISSGIYSAPIMPPEETEQRLYESRAKTAFIDSISFYQLSEADVDSIKTLRKKQFKTLLIIIAAMDLVSVIVTAVFHGMSLIIMLAILIISSFVIGYLFKKLLTGDPREEYSARHVIIKGRRSESVMYSSGESSNTYFYTLETSDTHEILSDISLNDKEALVRSKGTEVILVKDKKGMYKIFNI
ncbi:MAG: hypothetical protein IKW96_02360 [Ruminococcus sp.]|uniref:hypothetical protein n=1 Tax=Ruminococcus sp. TaxID=41978 RepID=UPI0025D90C50|nr:hypothetical protein [Ruminococcus sp.]MBR5682114.1 hypothetical protein [Ruminococcus sp.]